MSPQIIAECDLMIRMRDDVRIAADVYRPDSTERFPVLYSCSLHNKDMQGLHLADDLPPQPAYSTMWFGPIEAGDTRRLLANGYIHVIAQSRGTAKSGGEYLHGGEWDHYDTIEWITQQPWCDGNVGMIGISAFAGEQWRAATQQHPALKAIFPYDACSAYGGMFGFRDFHPGGVVHTMPYILDSFSTVHEPRGVPGELPPDKEVLWRDAVNNPDYRMYANLYNILTQKGQRTALMYHSLTEPWEPANTLEEAQELFGRIKIPFYTGSGAYAYSYKLHWLGAQHYFRNVEQPRKLLFTGPAHVERPFSTLHDEIIRWYDHWLKGIDTGIMDEPAVRYWVMGANEWRTATDWPIPETNWTRYHLASWERLTTEPPAPAELASTATPQPDAFVQMPPTLTRDVARLRYLTEPLANDVLVAGPISLTLYAAIDQDDTNWIVSLKDVGPDVSVRTAREGEREVPDTLPERELTRGWLKASYRELDSERSTDWEPFHRLTKDSIKPVEIGSIVEYKIQILATANMFKAGHRICLDIMSADMPTGTGGMSHVEYQAYHVVSSKTVCHRIYRDGEHPSHLLLPEIPLNHAETNEG